MSPRRRRESRDARQGSNIVKKRIGGKPPVPVLAKTDGQQVYIDAIEQSDIIICDGLAGTGKSLLSVGMAIKLLRDYPETYNKIVMVRPAVSVQGEDLGFLPGGIDEKMHPYMMPLLNSMRYFIDESVITTMMGNGALEIIPVSFIRGLTFNNTIVIFDEAQNASPLQMKTFLTRIGFNTKAIVEGDISQSDLQGDLNANNGLQDVMDRLSDVEGVSIVRLGSSDVVRSPIVARILKRYDE